MRCRLCLVESADYLSLFKENNALESEIAKMIVKYLHMEILCDDAVSSKICQECWEHLHSFHKFSLYVEQKQETLKQLLPNNAIDFGERVEKVEEVIMESYIENEDKTLDDMQDLPLSEPQIDAMADDILSLEGGEFPADLCHLTLKEETQESEVVVTRRTKRKSAQAPKRETPKRKSVERAQRLTKKATKMRLQTSKLPKQSAVKKHKQQGEKYLSLIPEMDAYIAAHATLSCSLCTAPVQNFNALKRHFRKEHQCLGYVVCCGSRFLKRTLFVDHLKLHEDPEYFKCVECNKVLASRNCYYHHMAAMHPPEEELKFQCEYCARKFAKQYILDYHLNSHKNDRSENICTECNKGFRSVLSLKAHHHRMHLNATVTICDICGKNFRSNYSLKLHKASVHQGVQLPEAQCTICQKWVTARTMYKHMYKHKDEESGIKFECQTCGAVKQTRHSLGSHIRYHHSDKAFNCTLCNKVFKGGRALEEHMATHTGKDLYNCAFCTRTFKSYANMHNHKKKMHPNDWVRKYTQPSNAIPINNEDGTE